MTPETAHADGNTGWDGLFGPDSMTWRLHSDPVLFVAGLRALLLQAVHPVAMAGVLTHSDFRSDPWGRLARTADYVGTVNFGTMAEVKAAGARVRAMHSKVSGFDPHTQQTYSASDPELLMWVHCCEVESFLDTYRRANGLSRADADRYYDEQRHAAAVVGLDPEQVPGSVPAMADYFASMRPQLSADARTRAVARLIVVPDMPRRVAWLTPARPAWAAGASLAIASLPRWARRLYGLPALPTTDLAATAGLRALAIALRGAPQQLRQGPQLQAAKLRAESTG